VRSELGRIFVWPVALALGAGACGGKSIVEGNADDDDVGPSGVPSNSYLDELTLAERQQLCPWAIAAYGGPGERMCGDFNTSIQTVEGCVALESDSHCLVRIFETCLQSLDGNVCILFTSPACDAYTQCAFGT
jgi:hypothetical protein